MNQVIFKAAELALELVRKRAFLPGLSGGGGPALRPSPPPLRITRFEPPNGLPPVLPGDPGVGGTRPDSWPTSHMTSGPGLLTPNLSRPSILPDMAGPTGQPSQPSFFQRYKWPLLAAGVGLPLAYMLTRGRKKKKRPGELEVE